MAKKGTGLLDGFDQATINRACGIVGISPRGRKREILSALLLVEEQDRERAERAAAEERERSRAETEKAARAARRADLKAARERREWARAAAEVRRATIASFDAPETKARQLADVLDVIAFEARGEFERANELLSAQGGVLYSQRAAQGAGEAVRNIVLMERVIEGRWAVVAWTADLGAGMGVIGTAERFVLTIARKEREVWARETARVTGAVRATLWTPRDQGGWQRHYPSARLGVNGDGTTTVDGHSLTEHRSA